MEPFNAIAQTRYGAFLYNRNDQIIGRCLERYGEYSEAEVDLLRQLCGPGSVVADVGANIGAIAVPLALHVGAAGFVYAFEPERITFQTLCANVALHSLPNVECVHAAVGASHDTLHLPDLRYDLEANFGGLELHAFAQGRPVAQVTLDDYVDLAHFTLLKIDVEGMEREVIAGAQRLLATQRPLLYVENDRIDQSDALIAAIQEQKYRCYWHTPPLFNPSNARGNAENIFSSSATFVNMLCVPIERPSAIQGFEEARIGHHPLSRP